HTSSRLQVLTCVLDLLAGLLDVARGLVGLALGLEPLVADGLAGGLLGLALDLLGLVLGLVGVAHWRSFPSWSCVPGPLCPRRTGLTRLGRPPRVVHRGEGRETRRRRCQVLRTMRTGRDWDGWCAPPERRAATRTDAASWPNSRRPCCPPPCRCCPGPGS